MPPVPPWFLHLPENEVDKPAFISLEESLKNRFNAQKHNDTKQSSE